MRSLVALTLVALVLSGSSFFVAALPLATEPDDLPLAPGPYTGPPAHLMPAGTQLFADDVHKQCGKYALVFRNKDLREDANDFIHAQGTFFIQFQAVGKGSAEITRFSFSFGATHDLIHNTGTVNCNSALPDSPAGKGTGGAYLMYYRSDFSKADGFFVPIKTNNVPDGEYGAAVHAYNAAGNEVARAWARAKVDNCPTDIHSGISAYNCAQDPSDKQVEKDLTLPWPMVLPGDGVQTNKENGAEIPGLTVEFAEPILDESLTVYQNGKQLPMEKWENPMRDSDLVPLNDETECTGGQQIRVLCERIDYGPGFKHIGAVNAGDIIRVAALDLNKNYVERTIHVGAATSGGTVELEAPELALEVLNDDDVFIKPGEIHYFNARVSNIGGGEAHVSLLTNVTRDGGRPMDKAKVEAYWVDPDQQRTDHVMLARGEEVTLKVKVVTNSMTPEDHYYVNGLLEYDVDGQQTYKKFDGIVDVNKEATGNHQHLHDLETIAPTNETALPLAKPGGDSPGPALGLVLSGLAGVVAVVTLRRGRKD